MKITVIGGGSTYTPELVSGFIKRSVSLPLGELWLMDIDAARLGTVGGFAQRMVEAAGSPFRVVLSGDRAAALEGARVGWQPRTMPVRAALSTQSSGCPGSWMRCFASGWRCITPTAPRV